MGHRLFTAPTPQQELRTNSVVACLGNFDGLHRGHQEILHRVSHKSSSLSNHSSALISFHPHPASVLKPQGYESGRLSRLSQRLQGLARAKVELLITKRFTKAFSLLRAPEFVESFLLGECGVRYLFMGEDARFGHRRHADAEEILRLLRRHGCDGEIVPTVPWNEKKIGSRDIRRALREGELAVANSLLGRPFGIIGRVVHGAKRGRSIGFPTANLNASHYVLPSRGVYLAQAILHGSWHRAVVNIGVRPTVAEGEEAVTVEAHLLDWPGEQFYGAELELFFLHRVRSEQKFSSLQALRAQIERDCAAAREYLLADSLKEEIASWSVLLWKQERQEP